MSETREISLGNAGQVAYRQSTDAANICKDIVLKTVHRIGGGRHVGIEGWQAIANVHGCVLCSGDVRREDTGMSATGQVKRVHDGVILATADGFVGNDERTWASRPEYARRAMAQTRAMSRAARSVFGHVVVMMNEGLSTTPAEEMVDESPAVQVEAPPASGVVDEALGKLAAAESRAAITDVIARAKMDVETGTITPGQYDAIASAGRSRWAVLAS